MDREDFHALIQREHHSQRRDSDKYKHDYDWLGLVMEEVGEVAECINEGRCPIDELVQVSTLIEAWVGYRGKTEGTNGKLQDVS